MSRSLNKSESLTELSNLQEEAVSGGTSSFPKIPNVSYIGLSFGRLFGLEINKTSFYEKTETSDNFSKSDKDGDLSTGNSKVEEIDINRLTIG